VNAERVKERILARINFEDRGYSTLCWISTRAANAKGYTKMSVGARTEGREYVHRLAYVLWIGPLPKGNRIEVDHLCRQEACCRPTHLEAVENLENKARSGAISKERCRNGHRLTKGNLYVSPRGDRQCRRCRTASSQRSRERRRDQACGRP